MMGREQEIEEIAEAIFQNCNCGLFYSEAEKIARFVIEEQGYRKQNEVVKEIFDDLKEKLIFNTYGIATISNKTFCELKKKYTGEKEDEQVH